MHSKRPIQKGVHANLLHFNTQLNPENSISTTELICVGRQPLINNNYNR